MRPQSGRVPWLLLAATSIFAAAASAAARWCVRCPAMAALAALALLERVGLGDKADAYPDSLSGGQQQRVALVRAVAMRPDLLLLDEVTSALDPQLVGEVLDVIRDLKGDGLTIIMATHEMDFAREVADRIVFLADGRVVESGSPSAIFGAPQDPRTVAFLARHRG